MTRHTELFQDKFQMKLQTAGKVCKILIYFNIENDIKCYLLIKFLPLPMYIEFYKRRKTPFNVCKYLH